MPTLILRFPGRRYHATPWGHHVNEGLVEWPPSPWRLLRALLSTGYAALGWAGDTEQPILSTPPDDGRSLIVKLASALPQYRLPAAAGAHTRHYMPLSVLDKGREKTTLVFDTWAQVDDGELCVTWDVDLTPAETALLARLAGHLGYLGRSESWVVARLARPDEPTPDGSGCQPCEGQPNPGPGWEQVALMAPVSAEDYAAWRDVAVAKALAPLSLPQMKPPKELSCQRAKLEAPYPANLIACLQADTTWLHNHGWSQPPGSRRVFYWRRTDSLEAGAPQPRLDARTTSVVEAMLLAMATAGGNDRVLPTTIRTLPQAEVLHRALVGAAQRQSGHSTVLSGCDDAGAPRAANHDHAHIVPLDLDGDGHLEHVLVWAPMGLDAGAQAAIRAVRQTFTKGRVGALKLALVASGSLSDLRRLPGRYGDCLRTVLGPESGTTEWVSLTPFVPPRHVKTRGRNTLAGQVAAELSARGLPAPLKVSTMPLDEASGRYRLRHFIRQRRRGASPPVDCGFSLRIQLSTPFSGPIALGYGSHFGLGLFMVAPQEHV
jgi:CRISPR-associated protein Csb2